MAVFKCKMCGGDLNVSDNITVAECQYCGTKQTIPCLDSEKKTNLFNRANRLRINGEFDKAATIYENIVAEFPKEAEAYWGLVICNYGIEYVDDPLTAKKIPTCHRASFDTIENDENYKMALEYADVVAQKVYRDEAREIERLRNEILDLSKNEPPYDIFICYKETDDKGERTVDSVIAQDTYDALCSKGYRVFFSRITLEDKLGMQYEPYIFAALNSAKIMLAFGTKYEYYHAVWVKNEWNRFLKLMHKDRSKALIPCYKDLDPYDMPDEFKALQAQDMGKIGAMQDLLRGIEKILPKKQTAPSSVSPDEAELIATLIKRIYMFLDEGYFETADTYCEKVLNLDPECGSAYLAKLLAELHCRNVSRLRELDYPLINNKNFSKAMRFGNENEKAALKEAEDVITEKFNNALITGTAAITKEKYTCPYCNLRHPLPSFVAKLSFDEEGYSSFFCNTCGKKITYHISVFEAAGVFGISAVKLKLEKERARERVITREQTKKDDYDIAVAKYKKAATLADYTAIINTLSAMGGYQDADTILADCRNRRNKYIPTAHKSVVERLACGQNHIIGLKNDGNVLASGLNYSGECDVRNWHYIIAVSVGMKHTVGLKRSGKVESIGNNSFGQLHTYKWDDIIAVSAGNYHTVGLREDGSLVATGDNRSGQCNVDAWYDVSYIAAGGVHTIGLKNDGTVLAAGDNSCGQCDAIYWKDIVAIAAGGMHTVGLKSDGTVVAIGNNSDGQCDIANWNNIVGIAAGPYHTVGIKNDSTVVVAGYNPSNQYSLSNWENIIDVSVGDFLIAGLKSDGTVVTAGEPKHSNFNVGAWTLFENIDPIMAEYEELQKRLASDINIERAKELSLKAQQRISLNAEKSELEKEYAHLVGAFTGGKRKAKIEVRLKEINQLLEQLSK